MNSRLPYSLSARTAVVLFLILSLTALIGNRVGSGRTEVITWDVYGYYLYLPALFIYEDTRAYRFTDQHLETYSPSGDIYQLIELEEDLKAPVYTMGLALLQLPFFALAHLTALLSPAFPADGLSQPYQLAMVFSVIFFLGLGLYYLRKVLRSYCSESVTALVLVLLTLGTNYLEYATLTVGLAHSYLFSLYALLLWLIPRWYQHPSPRRSLQLGLLMAIICLVRPSEVIAGLLLPGYALLYPVSLQEKIRWLMRHWKALALILFAGIIGISPQLAYWKINLGHWIHNGYAEHHFDFLRPHLWEGIFGYRKGWLLYTPLMVLPLLGLPLLFRYRHPWALPVTLFFLLHLYITFSWHIWWYGSTFGSRAMVQAYALLSLPLGLLLEKWFWVKKWRRVLFLLLLTAGLGLNLFQDWQYQKRILPLDETTRTYYWQIFGRIHLPQPDLYKYLDVDEKLPRGVYREISLARWKEEAQRIGEFSPSARLSLDADSANRWSEKWVRVKAEVKYRGEAYDKWRTAYLVFSADRGEDNLKWTGVRFQRFVPQSEWREVSYELKLPELEAGDQLQALVWNQGPDTVYVQRIEILGLKQ